ncbi:MAG: AsmA family protein [Candidatus Omnitrophica bacterium]|nr:AsmA family protein [Candidatus Omnitrophota bacterium]
MNKYAKIAAAVVIIIFVAAFAKDAIIKVSVEKGVELVTGLKLSVGGLHVGIIKPVVSIKNLKLLNPPSFPDRTMVNMPEIYVKYDLPAIVGGTIHLPEVRLALKEFVVVKNSKGELNLDALRTVQAQKKGASPSQDSPGKAPAIKIDSLRLSIGKVIYKDYSKSVAPDVKEFNINLNESYSDIDDPYELASLIVVKALMNTSIASLANFDLRGLQGTVGGALQHAQKMASTAQATITNTHKGVKQAVDAAGKAADTVKNIFSDPFNQD